MYKFIFVTLISTWLSLSTATAQKNKKVYQSKFIPVLVTFNGSPNPNECWESVVSGINIKISKANSFFSMEYKEIECLKEKIGEAEVLIEVIYYDEPITGRGEMGRVEKITLNNEVIFESK